jgi:flagellar M-ring protein FliF
VLGPDGATVSVPAVPSTVPQNGYQVGDQSKTYAVDRTVTELVSTPGAVSHLRVAVLLDSNTIDDKQATEIQSLVLAASGADGAADGKVTVTRLPFDTTAVKAATDQAKTEAAAAAKTRMMELIRTLAVAFVILIALVLAYRSTRKARKITVTPISVGEIAAVPRASNMNLELVGVGGGGGELAAVGAGGSHGLNSLALAMDNRNDSPMTEIAEIAQTRPEEVANVLRAWLNEGKQRR